MCNYPNNILITFNHKPSGRTVYSFTHWPFNEGKRSVVYDMPSHRTQTIQYIDESELEEIERTQWSE